MKKFIVKNYKAIREDFMTHFPNHKPPYKTLIIYWVSKFRSFGTVENFNRKIPDRQSHSDRKRILGEVLKDRIRESATDSPHQSTVRRCQELEISQETLRRVLKKDIDLFPYPITTQQKLTDNDKTVSVYPAKVLCDKIEASAANAQKPSKTFLSVLWTSSYGVIWKTGIKTG